MEGGVVDKGIKTIVIRDNNRIRVPERGSAEDSIAIRTGAPLKVEATNRGIKATEEITISTVGISTEVSTGRG